MNTLKAYWQHLVTREKALFKSFTMWLAAFIAAAPTLLPEIQSNFPTIAPYLPKLLQEKGMGWIALAIAVCRLKSMVRLPPPAPLPPPVSR